MASYDSIIAAFQRLLEKFYPEWSSRELGTIMERAYYQWLEQLEEDE